MKVFISADMEGIAGATHWDETEKAHRDYPELREQMTAEVAAACEGALSAGATEIVVKDAHWTGRNLIAARLPREVRLHRGWSLDPYSMMAGLDESFSAALLIGYHSRSGADTSPLAHSFTERVSWMRINDRDASEFMVSAYTAGLFGVPLVFLSGDAGICRDAVDFVAGLPTVATQDGAGESTTSIHPAVAVERIRGGVQAALRGDVSARRVSMPPHFAIEVSFRHHSNARQAGYYPGARQTGPAVVAFEADAWFDVLRFLMFTVSMMSR